LPYVMCRLPKAVTTVEQKRGVIRRITEVLVDEFGRNPEYMVEVIDEVDRRQLRPQRALNHRAAAAINDAV
jgi:4-oxalocrotonate tautomerase family enzyme